MTRASGVAPPVALELLDFDDDFVERRVDGVLAGVREVRQVGFGGRAGDVELGRRRRGSLERAARVLDRRLVLVGLARSAGDRLVGGRAPSSRSASSARTSASSCASPATIAARSSSTRRRVSSSSAASAPRALLELGAGFLEPLRLRRRAPPRARRAPRARRRLRRRGGSDPRRPRAPRTGGAAPTVSRSSAGALLVFEPRDRRARFVLAAVERVALLLGLTPLARELLAPSARAASASSVACCSCASWPTTAFSCLWCSAFSAAIAFDAVRDRRLERRGLLRRAAPAPRARPRSDRAAP